MYMTYGYTVHYNPVQCWFCLLSLAWPSGPAIDRGSG